MTDVSSADGTAKTVYFCSINLTTGKISRQDCDLLSIILDGDPDESGIERHASGIWWLGHDEYSDNPEGDLEITCFSMYSHTHANALCLEEFSIFKDSTHLEYCQRVRQAPCGYVDWPEEYDANGWGNEPAASSVFDWATVAKFDGQMSLLGVQ